MSFWEEVLGRIVNGFLWLHFWRNPDHLLKLVGAVLVGLALWKLWIDLT